MNRGVCGFCALIWQLYDEAKKNGIPFELPQSEQYVQAHIWKEHNVQLRLISV